MNPATTTGTIDWSMRTGGHLAAAERRRLVADLARVQVRNAVGRLSLLAHLNPGRHAYVPPAHLVPPDSPLTRAATDAATRVLPSTPLNHSYRAYRFGALTLSGALLLVGFVVNAIERRIWHPTGAEDEHESIFTEYAASNAWVATPPSGTLGGYQ